MAQIIAASIHFGRDDDGYFFSFVAKASGKLVLVRLNKEQVKLLAVQTTKVVFNEFIQLDGANK